MVSAVEAVNGVPPVATLYHFKDVPVAVKSATVPLPQNVCVVCENGAFGIGFKITATIVLVLSQFDVVCET